MSDNDKHLPQFFRDFHDQKDFVKAFWKWTGMLDKMSNEKKRRADPFDMILEIEKIDRTHMCSWVDFMILLVTLLEFLSRHGWVLRRVRGYKEVPEINDTVSGLLNLENAWHELVAPGAEFGPHLRDDLIDKYMEPWLEWLPYMPDDVQEAWRKRKGY